MKLNCLIVDDEPLAIEVIQNYVARHSDLQLAATCRSAAEASVCLETLAVDLVFLDIRMPDVSGLELAKTLGKLPMVIFTTASREFAVQSYDTFAVDYLVKPVHFESFYKAVGKALDRHKELMALAASPSPTTLLVKSESKTFRISIDQVEYIESIKDHVVIHLADGSTVVSYTAISTMEHELQGLHFLRIHRSFLVAVHKVTAFNHTCVDIGQTQLPIGRTYKDEVLAALLSAGLPL